MTEFYTPAQRELQARFDTVKLADLMTQAIVHTEIDADKQAFIESRDMFFLATVDPSGQPTCSYKGGDPGFVRVVDPRSLAFPVYDGNGMFLSVGNLQATHQVGILFIDFETPHRLRVQGTASASDTDPLLAHYDKADLIVRVAVTRLWVNCSRYIHRYQLVRRSRFVPRSDCPTPVPEWKRSDWAFDALPADDPARDPGGREVLGR